MCYYKDEHMSSRSYEKIKEFLMKEKLNIQGNGTLSVLDGIACGCGSCDTDDKQDYKHDHAHVHSHHHEVKKMDSKSVLEDIGCG